MGKKERHRRKLQKLSRALANQCLISSESSQTATTSEPKPSTSEPKPSAKESTSSTGEPGPTTSEPALSTSEPSLSTSESAPTSVHAPTISGPDPTTSEPVPATIEPTPTTSEPEPTPSTSSGNTSSLTIILDDEIDPALLATFPKVKSRVPPVFLHKPVAFEQHVKRLITLGVQFYKPHRGKYYTRVPCVSFNDHKLLLQYLDKKQLPYHTFGHPSKRKMKVVIRGLPKGTDVDEVKEVLKSVSIPVIRVHQMETKEERRDNTILVLAVVPYDDEGKIILRVSHLMGHKVKLEPANIKTRQCHRCQKWGHSQRYCHGIIRCVKCAGYHMTNKCEKHPDEKPKCANCKEDHTANCKKKCVHAPGSEGFDMLQSLKIVGPCYAPNEVVTMQNYNHLYKNVDYNKPSRPLLQI